MKKYRLVYALCCVVLILAFSSCVKEGITNTDKVTEIGDYGTIANSDTNNNQEQSSAENTYVNETSNPASHSDVVQNSEPVTTEKVNTEKTNPSGSARDEKKSPENTSTNNVESEISITKGQTLSTSEYTENQAEYSGKNVFLVSNGVKGEDGLIKVLVSLGGDVSICGADAEIRYPDELELVDVNGDFNANAVVNADKTNKTVYFNFSFAKNKNQPLEIIELTFKAQNGVSEVVPVEIRVKSAKEIKDNRISDAEYHIVNGEVRTNE